MVVTNTLRSSNMEAVIRNSKLTLLKVKVMANPPTANPRMASQRMAEDLDMAAIPHSSSSARLPRSSCIPLAPVTR